jgi:capsule polysaccharide export protein KpsE/RkpR
VQSNYAESEVPRSGASMKSGLTDAIDFREPRSIFDDDYVILDQKKVPQNVIEQIENRMIKVNRRLKK